MKYVCISAAVQFQSMLSTFLNSWSGGSIEFIGVSAAGLLDVARSGRPRSPRCRRLSLPRAAGGLARGRGISPQEWLGNLQELT